MIRASSQQPPPAVYLLCRLVNPAGGVGIANNVQLLHAPLQVMVQTGFAHTTAGQHNGVDPVDPLFDVRCEDPLHHHGVALDGFRPSHHRKPYALRLQLLKDGAGILADLGCRLQRLTDEMDLLASMREEVGTAQRLHMVLLNDQEDPITDRCLLQQRRSQFHHVGLVHPRNIRAARPRTRGNDHRVRRERKNIIGAGIRPKADVHAEVFELDALPADELQKDLLSRRPCSDVHQASQFLPFFEQDHLMSTLRRKPRRFQPCKPPANYYDFLSGGGRDHRREFHFAPGYGIDYAQAALFSPVTGDGLHQPPVNAGVSTNAPTNLVQVFHGRLPRRLTGRLCTLHIGRQEFCGADSGCWERLIVGLMTISPLIGTIHWRLPGSRSLRGQVIGAVLCDT